MNKTKKRALKIIVAGGGTGGHLFPGMAIAEEIIKERPSSEVRYVGTDRGIEAKVIPETGNHLYKLPVSGLYRVGLKKKLFALLKLPLAFIQSAYINLAYRPDLVIGVGGYASGPFLATAILLGRKTIIQEQNAFPGMTNRILGKLVPLSFVPFKGLEKVFKNPVVVGNPIRESIRALAEQKENKDKRNRERFKITLFGGSQGARILNETIIKTLPLLKDYKDQISLLHQTGKYDYQKIRAAYQGIDFDIQATEFIENMGEAYKTSHLLLCRAGSSVSEIIAVGRASILVPIARSSGDHQKNNALAMKSENAAIMIEEKDLTPEKLAETIIKLINQKDLVTEMEKNARLMYKGNAAGAIVEKTLNFFNL